jgi:chaperone modulatory protein CbpM
MNTTTAITVNQALAGDLLEEVALSLEELARACRVPPDWVIERVESGFLEASTAPPGQWRFASASLVRARRLCNLETTFEAGPEIAALAADLIEEVERLRQRLRAAGLDALIPLRQSRPVTFLEKLHIPPAWTLRTLLPG